MEPVHEALYQVTKDRNSRDNCKLLDIWDCRKIAGLPVIYIHKDFQAALANPGDLQEASDRAAIDAYSRDNLLGFFRK